MIRINNQARGKVEDINKNNFYVVADFDKTITSKNSNTTFSLFSKSGFYPKEYLNDRNKNYDHYRPLELDPTIKNEEKERIVKEWQEASYELMLKYKVKEADIKKILSDPSALTLRNGAVSFIKTLYENNIPLIICSAGVGNFIIELLKLNSCYSDNIYVHSNMLEFKNGVIYDSIKEIIHSMNKNDIILEKKLFNKLKDKKYGIIIGDQLSDLNMINNLPRCDTLSFGFLESNVDDQEELFYKDFDVVLKENEGFDKISKILKLK